MIQTGSRRFCSLADERSFFFFFVRKLNDDITWVGADDRRLHLFENLFPLPHGVSYNSYVITDEKTAILDTADDGVLPQFMDNLLYVLGDRQPDYIVVNHMEPDHCSGIKRVLDLYPECKMVGNAKIFTIFEQFYGMGLSEERKVLVKEGDELSLGKHVLKFIMAPMVHWPEVMMTYDMTDKILFSADAFGTFGSLDGNLFDDELDFNASWLTDARRYYTNIVGKYGQQVQSVLKKAAGLDIKMIAPLHGPVWRTNIPMFLEKYDIWSSYEVEDKGSVLIVYGSMYGNTKELAEILATRLAERGVKNIKVYDVSETEKSYLIAECFRCEYLVFAAPTYNNGLYPKMAEFMEDMKNLTVRKRKATVLGNGSWAPQSDKIMRNYLSEMKDMDVSEKSVVIKSRLKPEQSDELEEVVGDIVSRLSEN